MTTVTATREALAPALARAAAIVPNRNTIPILDCALLEASDAGLFVTATDMDIVFRERVDTTPREPWCTCVDAERLETFVAGAAPDGDVALRADDEGRLWVHCGRAACRLPTLPAENFPLFTHLNDDAVELIFDAAAFAAGLAAVAPAMADEQTRYYLCGAYLCSGKLCATNGHQLALKTVTTDTPPAPEIIVPAPTVRRLVALLRRIEGPLSTTVSPTQLIVSTSSWTLTSKVIDGPFPDYQRVIPERLPHPLLVRREALHHAATLVAKVGRGDKTTALRLTSRDSDLLVAGSNAFGDCEITIPIEGGMPAGSRTVGVNPKYLLSALDPITAEIVELHIVDLGHPVWVCAAGEAHDGSVIMPMRV